MCITFSQPRRIIYRGSASEDVLSVGSIIAGSKFAIDCLHILLLWLMDAMLRLFPQIDAAKYVTDLAIVAQGVAEHVTEIALLAFDWLADHLAEQLEMKVSLTVGAKSRNAGLSI